EQLHAVIEAADPDAVVPVHLHGDGPEAVLGVAQFQVAEAAGLGALVAPGQQRLPLRRELLDAATHSFGGVEAALAVPRQEMRSAEARTGRLRSAELAWFIAIRAPLAQELALGGKLLHAVVVLVGDEQWSVRRQDNPTGAIELPIPSTPLAPFADQLAG